MRILGIAEGTDPAALSGIPANLLDALDRRFEVVGRVDYSATGPTRLALAAASFRPDRAAWRARFHTSPLARSVLSRSLRRRAGRAPDHDVALQVMGWAQGQPRPYALYVDQTRLMAERGWPDWMPLARREREATLSAERGLYAAAGHLFTMGGSARASLLGDYGIAPELVTVVGGGLNYPALPEPRPPTLEPVVLFAGREFERKGGDVLLDAFAMVRARHPSTELHIAGVELRSPGAGVEVHGRLGRDDLAALYRRARVFCMPSRYEPWGLVFAEAMSHGVACVGSETGAIPEILGHGEAGLTVAPGDAGALAEALLAILGDDALAQRLGAAGRRRVETQLLWDHVAERMSPGLRAAAASYIPTSSGPTTLQS